jgi:protein-L-isoaspartate(D-aspartate) O-methyltransferase
MFKFKIYFLKYMFSSVKKSNSTLIDGLIKEGIIKSSVVGDIMRIIDRSYYCPTNPYEDRPQYLGYNATISAPHMHAYALVYINTTIQFNQELLKDYLVTGKRSLDVGSGSGYLAVCMAKMMPQEGKCYGIEHIPELVKQSIKNVQR